MARLPVLLFGFMLVASACPGTGGPDRSDSGGPVSTGVFRRSACSLPDPVLARIWNGYHPQRSGEIQMLLKERYTFSYEHAGPWDYLEQVPLLFYGPGHVPARGRVRRPVTLADVAPTLAGHLRFDFHAPDGRGLREALPARVRRKPPRLILVVVWDGGGRNVLRYWPEAWPTLRGLVSGGVWFDNATLGTSPSITPPVHTTIGTGAFPRRHGVVSLFFRVDGNLVPANTRGPRFLESPTLADLYDRAQGNRPVVGAVAFRDWHLGMIGHGSALPGGDRDAAALMSFDTGRWFLGRGNAPHYRFPEYVNDVPGLDESLREIDLEDGRLDGQWMGRDVVSESRAAIRTPAYTEWQTAVLQEVIRRERFGADAVPDLLFTNYKQIDLVGHWWHLASPAMEAVVEASDRALAELIRALDDQVGRGEWVLVVTADHGVIPNPGLRDGVVLRKSEFASDLEAAFGGDDDRPLIQNFRPTELYLNVEQLRDNGHTLEQVAAFILRYTVGDNLPDADLSDQERRQRAFAAAVPSNLMPKLGCMRRAARAAS